MLSKVTNVWKNLQKKKALADATNLITKKSTLFFLQNVSTTITYFILNNFILKLNKIIIFDLNKFFFNFYTLFFIFFFIFLLSFLFYFA